MDLREFVNMVAPGIGEPCVHRCGELVDHLCRDGVGRCLACCACGTGPVEVAVRVVVDGVATHYDAAREALRMLRESPYTETGWAVEVAGDPPTREYVSADVQRLEVDPGVRALWEVADPAQREVLAALAREAGVRAPHEPARKPGHRR